MPIKQLIENGYIIVVDTNVLLNVYKYSPEFSEFSLECLHAIGEHIILPATVRMEFFRFNRREFGEMTNRFEKEIKKAGEQIDRAKAKIVSSCNGLERLHFQDVAELRRNLEEKINDIKKELNSFYEHHTAISLIQHSWGKTDYLQDFVKTVEQDNRIMPALTQDEIYRWCEEGEQRYKKEIPPGFEDAKNKDGVKKYSDLIIWKEILRYVSNKSVNIIFVTDDAKSDWWEYINESRQFHSKLSSEFMKTGKTIVPLTSQEFYDDISLEYGINKTDAIEMALHMTDDTYCMKIAEKVFCEVKDDLTYDAFDCLEMDSAYDYLGSASEFVLTDHKYVKSKRIARDTNLVTYEFFFDVTLEGVFYDFSGRDNKTNEAIQANGKRHVFEGQIIVLVTREAKVCYDFELDSCYERAILEDINIAETSIEDTRTLD